MKLSAIVYNIDSPHIFVDCDQQEIFGQLVNSISSLRKYTDIPVVVYSNCVYSLDEFRYIQKYFIKKLFNNIETASYDKNTIPQDKAVSYCIQQTFDNFEYDSLMYISPWSMFNENPEEIFKSYSDDEIYKAREPMSE